MFVVKDVVSAVYWMSLERLARILTVVSWDWVGMPRKVLGAKRPCRAFPVRLVWMRTSGRTAKELKFMVASDVRQQGMSSVT